MRHDRWRIPLLFYCCALLAAICGAFILRHSGPGSIAGLSNLMGPLAENLANGRGYTICTDAMTVPGNVLCYRAARMPLPPLLLAGLLRIFGQHFLAAQLTKIALVLLPVAGAVGVAVGSVPRARVQARFFMAAILFAALLLPMQLIDAINMQVEEGYSFCLLAFAAAILLFRIERRISWRDTILFAFAVLGLYLTKSSMIAVAIFLVVTFCWLVQDRRKAAVVVLLFVAGPVGWGLHTSGASGHFSIGTSLDGINLHKGNYARFLDRYPPAQGNGLDRYDASLNAGMQFTREWQFNRFHMRAAEAYIRQHPARTAEAAVRKVEVFFFSLRKIGSQQYSGLLGVATIAGMVLFRLLLWSACGLALWFLLRGTATNRKDAAIYLGIVLSVAAPYIAGFALTRHAAVLILPSALFLCCGIACSGIACSGIACLGIAEKAQARGVA